MIKNALSLKNEPSMFIKVARVLVEAHQYDDAIKYYNKSGTYINLSNSCIKMKSSH